MSFNLLRFEAFYMNFECFQSLTRIPSSFLSPDFKNVFFGEKSPSPYQGPFLAIFEVAEAIFWILSIFYEFSFRNFVVLGFKVVWPQQPWWHQKGQRDFFQKIYFWNLLHSNKKDEACHSFLVQIFTKSLNRGGEGLRTNNG